MYTYDQSAYNRGSNSYGYQDAGYRGNAVYRDGYQQPRPLGYGGQKFGSGYQSRPNFPPPSPGHKILNTAFHDSFNHYGLWARCTVVVIVAVCVLVVIVTIQKF